MKKKIFFYLKKRAIIIVILKVLSRLGQLQATVQSILGKVSTKLHVFIRIGDESGVLCLI